MELASWPKELDYGVDMNPCVGKGLCNKIGCENEGGIGWGIGKVGVGWTFSANSFNWSNLGKVEIDGYNVYKHHKQRNGD